MSNRNNRVRDSSQDLNSSGNENKPSNLDMINRDPNSLNEFVKVWSGDVFAEPGDQDNTTSFSNDCVWQNSNKCFECGKNCCYKLFTCLTSLCTGLSLGCHFGLLAFYMVWWFVPCVRFSNIICTITRRLNYQFIPFFWQPNTDLLAYKLSRIQVNKSKAEHPPKDIMSARLHTYEFERELKEFKSKKGGGPKQFLS